MKDKNDSFSWVNQIQANTDPVFFILGPCSMENEAHTLKVAEFLKNLSEKLHFKFIFKSSFDKANRISSTGYRSVGFDEGLKILARVRQEFQVPVVTDIHESYQAEPVAAVVDVLQIPAMLCRQTDLLLAAGRTQKPINIKKGQFASADVMHHAVKKVQSTGNQYAWVCERGSSFGYQDLIVDCRNFNLMKRFEVPVIFDVTHALQKPGGQGHASGGDRSFAMTLAVAGVVQGIAGIFIEVHEQPEKALSDGPNSIRLSQLPDLMRYLIDLDVWVKQRSLPVIT